MFLLKLEGLIFSASVFTSPDVRCLQQTNINEDIIIKKLKTNCNLVKQVSSNFQSPNS